MGSWRRLSCVQSPSEQWIVNESLKYSHQGFFVFPNDSHYGFASDSEAALNVAHLHSERKHSRQPKWYALWVFFTVHCYFKAITKVNMDNLASDTVKH